MIMIENVVLLKKVKFFLVWYIINRLIYLKLDLYENIPMEKILKLKIYLKQTIYCRKKPFQTNECEVEVEFDRFLKLSNLIHVTVVASLLE